MSLKKLRVLSVLVFIVYAIESGSCVTEMYGASGIITSPNYPSAYPNYVDRAWLIHVTSGNSITLIFSNFNLESSSGCQNDYVEVRENSQYGTSLTGKMCGTDGLYKTVSSSTSLYVIFHTDNSGQNSGFRAQYVQLGNIAQYCTFTYGFTPKYCTHGCCYSSNDCCTPSSSSSSSGHSSSNDDDSHFMKGWVVAVIVGSCIVALSILSCILRCTVAASRSPTTTTTVRSPPVQPSVTVVSTAQQGTATAQPVAAYSTHYAPPGALTPPYYYNNAAYPPQDTAGSSKNP